MLNRALICVALLAVVYSLEIENDSTRTGRIMGGAANRLDAMASVRTTMLQGNFHICGAVIVNSN
jgi:hypothetical protein